MDEMIEQLQRLKDLFTADHMKELESLCDVWRQQVTDNPHTEFFYLGRRSVFLDLKRKLDTDLNKLKEQAGQERQLERERDAQR
jgi:uncharacterized protein Yka (UPF0111/DUF47 family)